MGSVLCVIPPLFSAEASRQPPVRREPLETRRVKFPNQQRPIFIRRTIGEIGTFWDSDGWGPLISSFAQ
jgi:hypothetical protein